MKKELISIVVSAILGAGVEHVISKFEPKSLIEDSILLALIVLTAAALRFLGPLKLILSSSDGVRLKGHWNSTWAYEKDGRRVEVKDEIKIEQYGRYIIGSGRSHEIKGLHPFRALTYKLEAEITHGGNIEGRWRNTDEGRRYRGAFQGHVQENGRIVNLRWLGSSTSGIDCGKWDWTKQ